VSGGDASGLEAPSEDPFQCSQALEIAEDKPHGKLPPVSEGENTRNRINRLLSLLNQHSAFFLCTDKPREKRPSEMKIIHNVRKSLSYSDL
jgi:hypothetical protein